jgi:hypothetical protein
MDNDKWMKRAFWIAVVSAFLCLAQLVVGFATWWGWKPQSGWLNRPVFQVSILQIILAVLCCGAAAVLFYAVFRAREKGDVRGTHAVETNNSFVSPRWQIVSNHRFTNELVEVDGKSFRDCSFVNAKLMFHGIAPTEFVGTSSFDNSVVLTSDNPAITLYAKLQRALKSAPNAKVEEGSTDSKGQVLAGNFEVQEAAADSYVPESLAAIREKQLVDEVNDMSADQMRQRINTDPEFVQRFNAIPKNKYRSLPQFDDEPDRYTDTFQKRTIGLRRELCAFLKELGPSPDIKILPGEATKEYVRRSIQSNFPRTERMHHGYERRFKDRVVDIYHEMKEHNFSDARFTELVASEVHSEKQIQEITDCLWVLAGKLET